MDASIGGALGGSPTLSDRLRRSPSPASVALTYKTINSVPVLPRQRIDKYINSSAR